MSSSFVEEAKDYASHHCTTMSRYTHYVGVPFVFFAVLVFLGFFRITLTGVFSIDFGWLFTVLVLLYYFKLDWRFALTVTPLFIIFNFFSGWLSHSGPDASNIWIFILLFIIGWACQLSCHLMEKTRPNISDLIKHTLLAPLFFTAELYFHLGKFYKLRNEIHGQSTTKKKAR